MPAVVSAHEERHGTPGEGVEGSQGREHVGGQAVVDELDLVRRGRWSDSGWAARGTRRSPRPSRVVSRLGIPSACSTARAMAALRGVVAPAQAERREPRRVAGRRRLLHPARPRPEGGRIPAQLAVGAVGHGELDARLGAQGELVGVVALDRPVPVEVVGESEVTATTAWTDGQVGDLVARRLDHPEVGLRFPGGSQGGRPMFPPALASYPRAPSRWTASAVVVLLPLVPVMQATRFGVGLGHPEARGHRRPCTPAPSSCATSGR